MADYNEDFTSSTTWNVNHALNNDTPLVDVMPSGFGGEREKALPLSIDIVDADNITVNWTVAQAGTVRVIG